MTTPTNQQIAASFPLWGEYFDTNAEMSEQEFDELSVRNKIALLEEAFGEDEEIKIVTPAPKAMRDAGNGSVFLGWDEEGFAVYKVPFDL